MIHITRTTQKMKFSIKGTVMQIETALINDRLGFQKYPANSAFWLFVIYL